VRPRCKKEFSLVQKLHNYLKTRTSLQNYILQKEEPGRHLDFFPENMGSISVEHGERFHQDISQTEKRYSGKWSLNILADCCWSLIWETPNGECKRQKKMKWVFNEFFYS
jgi:hypothetical protein